jgi:class 3 adenylate cyclase/tetratricopeptide (TPR) repeat protein
MQEIADWLEQLGMAEYVELFTENRIDFSVLCHLTDQDLKDIGIPLGHRRKILAAIGGLAGAGAATLNTATAERRQITVMFSDLVGSTALSARMDPEDLREVISAYQRTVADTVRRFDGFVARYMGDGVLAYFGYPRAHEDDAERAIRAGLELVPAVSALKSRASLQTRVGIATGMVVVGDLIGSGEAQEHGIVGETPNLAARLQGIAEANKVVICDGTRRLLGNLFELEDLGLRELKGIARPTRAWTAVRAIPVASRFEALRATGLTALVGREEETELLLRRWQRAKSGEGQVVLLSGEAGIGKSRLTAALLESLATERHVRLRYLCSPHHTDSAFYPIIGTVERGAGMVHDDTPQARLDKLDAVLAQTSTSIEDAALFAEMLSLPNDGRYPALDLTPEQRRQRTLDALILQMQSLTRSRPVLMIFEDAHWTDPTSLEALGRAVDRIATLRALLIVTFRPEFDPPWIGRPHVTALTINRLAQREVGAMIDYIVGNKMLPERVRQDIIERTDGIPLFVEEMTKAVLEAGSADAAEQAAPVPALPVPPSLHASLMARLDRLGAAKEVAQIGAAIGREFSHALLAAVVGRPEAELGSAIDGLVAAGLLFRQGMPPNASYMFKHALVQDAAYGTLLRKPRAALHARIAETLESRFADIAERQPEMLARHFTEAALVDRAIDYWLKAGHLALRRSANAEAVKHLRQGIRLTQSKAPSAKRVRQELDFYLALGPATAATEGYAAPETLNVFSHARALLGDGGTLTEQMTVLWGVYLAHAMRADYIAARDVAQQCLALAAEHKHAGMLALANRFMGQTLWSIGAFVDARSHLERTLDLCAANQETIASYRQFGANDQVTALSSLSRTLLILGYPEQAAAAAGQALARARSMRLAFTTAFALDNEALLGVLGADLQRAAAHADEAVAHSIEHSLADYEQRARFIQGALLARSGDPQRGIELMQNAIATIERTTNRSRRTLYLGRCAAAHASLGQPEVGLDLLDEAIQTAEMIDERFFEAELHRLRGNMLLALGRRDEAEDGLRRALTIAQQQQARWWELRAATSLAKDWRNGGKYLEAYSLLEPIYSWFGEGFDTTCLKGAKALVDELRDLSGRQTQNR